MNNGIIVPLPGEVSPPMGFLFGSDNVPLPDDAATDWRKGGLWRTILSEL
jgi:hypothetical protein